MEKTNYPSEKDDCIKFAKNNPTVALNVLDAEKEKICPAYVSKYHSKREKQFMLLMILSKEGWHYHTLKKLSAFLKGSTSNNSGDFYCLNCLHLFRIKSILTSHKTVSGNQDFCSIGMPSEEEEPSDLLKV